jgi:hypothetical protein
MRNSVLPRSLRQASAAWKTSRTARFMRHLLRFHLEDVTCLDGFFEFED